MLHTGRSEQPVKGEDTREMMVAWGGAYSELSPLVAVPSPPTWPLTSLLSSAASYLDALVKVQQLRGLDRAFLSWNDLQAAVCQVNAQVQEETDRECPPQTTLPSVLSLGLLFI